MSFTSLLLLQQQLLLLYKSTDYSDASLKLQGHFTYKKRWYSSHWYLKANNVNNNEKIQKVALAHYFRKCANAACLAKLSKSVRTCRRCSLPNLARYYWDIGVVTILRDCSYTAMRCDFGYGLTELKRTVVVLWWSYALYWVPFWLVVWYILSQCSKCSYWMHQNRTANLNGKIPPKKKKKSWGETQPLPRSQVVVPPPLDLPRNEPVMLIHVLVLGLKDSLRTKFKSLSLSMQV